MDRETTNAPLERVARLEHENAELRARIDRIRRGELPPPPRGPTVGTLAIVRLVVLTIGTAVALRFTISATHAERTAADLAPAAVTTCGGLP